LPRVRARSRARIVQPAAAGAHTETLHPPNLEL